MNFPWSGEARVSRYLCYWLPVAACAAIIFIISSIPEPPFPRYEVPHLDKAFHFFEFGILALLLRRALATTGNIFWRSRALFWSVFIAILYGMTDEAHQRFVPSREMSGLDVLCDGLGAAVSQLFYPLKFRMRRFKK